MTDLDKLEGITRDALQRLDYQFAAVVAFSGYLNQEQAARMRYLVNAARSAEVELFGHIVKRQEEELDVKSAD